MYRRLSWLALVCSLVASGCEEPQDLPLPSAEEVAGFYTTSVALDVEIRGNVAVLTIAQSSEQLRRGGSLWAKVGPYVYLFSQETHDVLEAFPGLGGVRVVTEVGSGTMVASALLARDELTDVLWRRSLNIAGRARRDGSTQVRLLEDLIDWGERHTEFEYNDRFVRR